MDLGLSMPIGECNALFLTLRAGVYPAMLEDGDALSQSVRPKLLVGAPASPTARGFSSVKSNGLLSRFRLRAVAPGGRCGSSAWHELWRETPRNA